MNLIIRIQATDKQGHVIHEQSGEVENFTGRGSLHVVHMLKSWIGEAVCSLTSKCVSTDAKLEG